MNRRIIFIISLLLIFPFLSAGAEEMKFSAGIYNYYAVWQPSWRGEYNNYKNDNLFLQGPVVSLSFMDNWNLSLLVIGSLFIKSESSYDLAGSTGSFGAFNVHRETTVDRADIDLALSRRVVGRMRIFAGIKYFMISENDDGHSTIDNSSYHFGFSEGTGYQVLSPALGVMYSRPVAGGLSVSFGTSCLAFKTKITILKAYESSPGEVKIDDRTGINKYNAIGNNSSIGLVYYFDSLGTTISLGGRFQVIKYYPNSGSRDLKNDYFYGPTLSFVKLF